MSNNNFFDYGFDDVNYMNCGWQKEDSTAEAERLSEMELSPQSLNEYFSSMFGIESGGNYDCCS